MIEAEVELSFLELLDRRIHEIPDECARHIGRRVEADHLLSDGVDHARRNFVTGSAGRLNAVRGGQRIAATVAHKRIADHLAVDGSRAEGVVELRHARERLGEIASLHG